MTNPEFFSPAVTLCVFPTASFTVGGPYPPQASVSPASFISLSHLSFLPNYSVLMNFLSSSSLRLPFQPQTLAVKVNLAANSLPVCVQAMLVEQNQQITGHIASLYYGYVVSLQQDPNET